MQTVRFGKKEDSKVQDSKNVRQEVIINMYDQEVEEMEESFVEYGKEYVDYKVPPGCASSPEVYKTQSEDYSLTEKTGKAGKDGKVGENWFLAPRGYFDNKLWNRGMQGAISGAQWGAGESGEIDMVGTRMLNLVAAHGYTPDDWYLEWSRLA